MSENNLLPVLKPIQAKDWLLPGLKMSQEQHQTLQIQFQSVSLPAHPQFLLHQRQPPVFHHLQESVHQ
ncbi:hypothetical protein AMECASPLE_029931 [Ameca splendens]|uniref:Uncharacterized protein n=1 Tax=Ameca splendens TaxID=208324 RepID=A0ABV1A1D9_9TELE